MQDGKTGWEGRVFDTEPSEQRDCAKEIDFILRHQKMPEQRFLQVLRVLRT
jgi:hypothetical protein